MRSAGAEGAYHIQHNVKNPSKMKYHLAVYFGVESDKQEE